MANLLGSPTTSRTWREQALIRALRVIFWVLAPIFGYIFWLTLSRQSVIGTLFSALVLFSCWASAFAPNIRYSTRAATLLTIMYVGGTYWLIVNGVPGIGRVYLLVFVVVAALVLDFHAALALWLFGVLTMGIIFWGFTAEWLIIPTRLNERMYTDVWLFLLWFVQTLISGGLVLAIVRLVRSFQRTLHTAETNQAALTQLNQELEQRIAARTAELRQQQALFQTFLDNAPIAIYAKDLEGRYTLGNQYMATQMGIERVEDFLGKRDQDFPVHNATQAWADQANAVIRTRSVVTEEVIVPTRHGSRTYLDVKFPLHTPSGELYGIAGVATDITERKHAEERLQALTRQMEAVQRLAQVGGWEVDLRTQQTFLSPVACQIHEIPEGTVMTIHESTEFYPTETRPMFTKLHTRLLEDGTPYEVEVPFITATGRKRYVRLNAQPRYTNGTITHLYGSIQDVTERKREELELRAARDQAEQANRAKSSFLANMSHELRTPLNAILGFTQLMLYDQGVLPQHVAYLKTINRSGEHLLRLINDVLTLAKIEAGQAARSDTSFNLMAMLDELEQMFLLRAREKHLTLRFDLAADLPQTIIADQTKLQQVLINLLANAVKFTQRGQVVLTVAPIAAPDSEAPADRLDTRIWLRFSVRDTGSGIAATDLSRIFKAFVQTENGKQQAGGTGLGLAISDQLVQIMGGTLHVESKVGVGSHFWLDLPIQLSTASPSILAPESNGWHVLAPDQPRYEILVVEDQPDNLHLICTALHRIGFQTSSATNGADALILMALAQPDLILMDMRMPIMDGPTTVQQIRAVSAWEQIPIVALTASVFDQDLHTIHMLGCNAVLQKPFSLGDLYEVLREQLGVAFVPAPTIAPLEPPVDPDPARPDPARLAYTPSPAPAAPYLPPDNTAPDPAHLPAGWATQMQAALDRGLVHQIRALLAPFEASHPAFFARLSAMLERHDYDALELILQPYLAPVSSPVEQPV